MRRAGLDMKLVRPAGICPCRVVPRGLAGGSGPCESGGQEKRFVYHQRTKMYKKNRKRGPQGVTQTTEYLGSYALPLLRTNAHILRLPFEL